MVLLAVNTKANRELQSSLRFTMLHALIYVCLIQLACSSIKTLCRVKMAVNGIGLQESNSDAPMSAEVIKHLIVNYEREVRISKWLNQQLSN
ncbi:hypothetical protein D3C75_673020 [compost metagenome]